MPNELDVLRSIDKKAAGSFLNVEYDEIDATYRTAGNGIGQVDTITYSFKGKAVLECVSTYDVSDRFIKLKVSKLV